MYIRINLETTRRLLACFRPFLYSLKLINDNSLLLAAAMLSPLYHRLERLTFCSK